MEQITLAHINALLRLPFSDLITAYDKTSENVCGSESLGINFDQYGSCFSMIMSKLPLDVRLQIAQLTTSDVWKV